jgi:outer membrane protein OmpA-like peptidoglycan-associated protein
VNRAGREERDWEIAATDYQLNFSRPIRRLNRFSGYYERWERKMDRNNRANEAKKSQHTANKPAAMPTSEGLKPEAGMSEAAGAVQRAKSAATPPLNPTDIIALQRSMGNKAVQRMLAQRPAPAAKVQRHWMEGEEKVQLMPMSRAFGDSVYAQRKAESQRQTSRRLWGNQAMIQRQPPGGAAPAPAQTAPVVPVFDPVTFAPNEIPADGTTTSQASVNTSPTGRTIKWSIDGEAFGSSVSNSGLVTPGTDTQGQEKVQIKVKAADDTTAASSSGLLTLWDAKFWQAKKDFPTFIGSNYKLADFRIGTNGKFDVNYAPAANTVNVDVRVKFKFPDDPIPQPSVFNLFGLLIQDDVAAAERRQKDYRNNFMSQIKAQWSGRYQFKNVREPQSIWGKLNPTTVSVNVTEDESNPHFTVNVYQKTKGTASVSGANTVKLFQGDDVPAPKFNPGTAAGELTRVNRNTPTPILFENNKTDIPAADRDKLQFLGTYLSRIQNPKFEINIVGHASKTGDAAKNQTLSEQRAQAVAGVLTGAGAGHHKITPSGVGQTGADATDQWRKVEIASVIPAGWQNMQDVTAHEFGHMLGLGDEYATTGSGPTATHYDLVKKAFGQDYADQVAKRGDTDYASIMEGGNDVRIQHYVTIWSGFAEATLKAAVPDPKFGYDDWKFIG